MFFSWNFVCSESLNTKYCIQHTAMIVWYGTWFEIIWRLCSSSSITFHFWCTVSHTMLLYLYVLVYLRLKCVKASAINFICLTQLPLEWFCYKNDWMWIKSPNGQYLRHQTIVVNNDNSFLALNYSQLIAVYSFNLKLSSTK